MLFFLFVGQGFKLNYAFSSTSWLDPPPPITWILTSKCHHFVYPSPISDNVFNVQPFTTNITWCKLKSGIFGYKYGKVTKYRCEMGMVTNALWAKLGGQVVVIFKTKKHFICNFMFYYILETNIEPSWKEYFKFGYTALEKFDLFEIA